jgi:serine protease
MRKPLIFPGLFLVLIAYSLGTTSADGLRGIVMKGTGTAKGAVIPAEVLVQFKDGTDRATQERAIDAAGGATARKSAYGDRYRVQLKAGVSVTEALGRLAAMDSVSFATPHYFRRALFTPNDPLFSQQWNLALVHSPRTWDIQEGDPTVVVAVIDTGVAFEDYTSPDGTHFGRAPDWGNTTFVTGLSVFTGDSHANDDNGHGTNVASVIAESTNNGIGYAGLAFNCALMPLRALQGPMGEGSDFGIAEAIDYARTFSLNGTNPVKVINMSLGGPDDDPFLDQAIDRAIAAGITVVAATGNDGQQGVSFPAAHSGVIAVGSVDSNAVLASYSNTGPEVSVVAPGGGCDFNDPNHGFVFTQDYPIDVEGNPLSFDTFTYQVGFCGTSQATPHVSAVAALLYRQGITSPAAVKAAIQSTAQHLGPGAPGTRNDQYGYGLVRPDQALAGLGLNQ